jgi:arylsulfatase A-like enzyme
MDEICPPTDRAAAGLLTDLERRGLLDETLVVIGGEFGRTPMGQGDKGSIGRDHHIKGFSMALAGGGIKGGITHGATDDFGYNAITDVVHVRDLHATMLHLLGIDHARFTVEFQGLDTKLTGVEPAKPVTAILA